MNLKISHQKATKFGYTSSYFLILMLRPKLGETGRIVSKVNFTLFIFLLLYHHLNKICIGSTYITYISIVLNC